MKTTLALSLFALAAAAQTPEVASVEVSQNSATRLVTVRYTIKNAPAIVTMDCLTNSVSIGAENIDFLEGEINQLVENYGEDVEHVFTWRPDRSWPGNKVADESAQIEVTAWAVDAPPDYMAVNLSSGDLRYYTSEAALPSGGITNDIYRTEWIVMRHLRSANQTFTMGSPVGEPGRSAVFETPHLVTFTNDYWLGVFELTQGQYKRIAQIADVPSGQNVVGDTYPLSVSTDATFAYLRAASNTATTPTWPQNGHEVLANSPLGLLRAKTGGLVWDLPTNALWEYACRAGTTTPYFWGNSTSDAGDYCWHSGNAGNHCHPVGTKKPNAWGFYDMVGNLTEMVLDRLPTTALSSDPVTDPWGDYSDNGNSVRHGAVYYGGGTGLRCGQQYGSGSRYSKSANGDTGYRLCITIY